MPDSVEFPDCVEDAACDAEVDVLVRRLDDVLVRRLDDELEEGLEVIAGPVVAVVLELVEARLGSSTSVNTEAYDPVLVIVANPVDIEEPSI